MSVLINGMQMPKCCYGCPFFKQVDYWNKSGEIDVLSKCKRTGEFTWESANGYLPNCPLVPIPPHGDLIDRDAMIADIQKNVAPTQHIKDRNSNMIYFLRHREAIIPAEGE